MKTNKIFTLQSSKITIHLNTVEICVDSVITKIVIVYLVSLYGCPSGLSDRHAVSDRAKCCGSHMRQHFDLAGTSGGFTYLPPVSY